MRQLLVAWCTLMSFSAVAQLEDVENVLSDLVFVSQRFVSPAADASVYQSTASWYTTAKGLGLFEVDVSLNFNVLPIGGKQKSYDVSNSDFSNLVIRGSNTAEVPTALGDDTEVFYDFIIDGETYEMQAFEGVKENVIIHPYLQASVGLWKETDLTVRYSPKIKFDKSDYTILGGAIKHNISQYFRTEGKEGIELAVLASYSTFDLNLGFDDFELKATNDDAPSLAVFNGLTIDAQALLIQTIVSRRFNAFELQGALGYTSSQVDYFIKGEESAFLDLFNQALAVLEETRSGFKGDIGANYYFGKAYISANVSVGKFLNTALAFHYTF